MRHGRFDAEPLWARTPEERAGIGRGPATTIARLAVLEIVVDLQETPATPPVDYGADDRYGWQAAGVTLIVLGWGFAVMLNLILHAIAPSSGLALLWVRIFHDLGYFAWAFLGLGLFVGAFGVVLIRLGRSEPRGPPVLPGYDYSHERLP